MRDEFSPGLEAFPPSVQTNGGRNPSTLPTADPQTLRSLEAIDALSDAELRFARSALRQEIATLRAIEEGRAFHFTADLQMKRQLKSRLECLLHCQAKVVAQLGMRNGSFAVDV